MSLVPLGASVLVLTQSIHPILPCLPMGWENKGRLKENSVTHTPPQQPLICGQLFKGNNLRVVFWGCKNTPGSSDGALVRSQVKLQRTSHASSQAMTDLPIPGKIGSNFESNNCRDLFLQIAAMGSLIQTGTDKRVNPTKTCGVQSGYK